MPDSQFQSRLLGPTEIALAERSCLRPAVGQQRSRSVPFPRLTLTNDGVRFHTLTSLRFVVTGESLCGMKFVIVFYEYAQAGLRRDFCIARRKLFFVMI